LQTKHKNIEKIALINYYHAQTQLPLFKVSRAITCFKTNITTEAKNIFIELSTLNFSKLSFDIKDYIEIQYCILGYLLFPKNNIYHKKIIEINANISFHYLQKYL
jgi:hypothetical protein